MEYKSFISPFCKTYRIQLSLDYRNIFLKIFINTDLMVNPVLNTKYKEGKKMKSIW
jgi:hypothetical protein